MRKIAFLNTLFVLALLMTACSSDDDSSAASLETIVGNWEIFEVRYQGTFSFGGFEETIDETFSTDSCDPTPIAVFSSDGTMVLTDFEVEIDFFGDEDEICFIDGELTGEWEQVSGSTFLFNIEGEGAVEVNVTLSNGNNRMTLTIEDSAGGEEFQSTFRANRT